mgnify:FL=1
MPSCIRTVDFTVTEKDISPSVPQWAGVQGEHQATRVRFQLPTSLTGDGFCYRVEWVDGMQSFGTSGALAASEDGKVSFLLPASWTAAGGTAEVRLCVCKDETDAANGQVFYSAVGRLTFSPRDENLPSVTAAENMLYTVMGEAERALKKAAECVDSEVVDDTGCVRFGGKLAFAYGRFDADANVSTEVMMPCTFTNVCFLLVQHEDTIIPVTGRTYSSFTIKPTKNIGNVFWFAVGTLDEN